MVHVIVKISNTQYLVHQVNGEHYFWSMAGTFPQFTSSASASSPPGAIGQRELPSNCQPLFPTFATADELLP